MRQDLMKLPAHDATTRGVNVIVETPRGSRVKYKYDEVSGLVAFDKMLPPGLAFPFDFGFVPSTHASDGDPLDMIVLLDAPTFPGCLVIVRLLGVVEGEQTQGGRTYRNDRLIGAPERSGSSRERRALTPSDFEEIEHFFVIYNQAQGREFRPLGRHGAERAEQLIREASGLGSRDPEVGANAGRSGS